MSMLQGMDATGHSASTAEFDQLTPQNIPATDTHSNAVSVKRALDIFGALVALVFFAPVMSIIYIVLMFTGGKPIFAHRRVGQNGGLFPCYKFRSMVRNSDEVFSDYLERNPAAREEWEYTCKLTYDPRVTGFGTFLRRSSLDELPQLFNVLKGDMSLVGPRPQPTFFDEKYRADVPRYLERQQVRPGLTGWAEVNDLRGAAPIGARTMYDVYYIENWSLALDLKCIVLTGLRMF